MICLFGATIIFAACKSKPLTYENDLGLAPSLIAQIDTANYSKIHWIDSVKDFGNIKEGERILIKFRFENSGDKPLFLSEVYPACGCTVAEYPKNAIMPGDGGELTAAFDSHNIYGFVHKTIRVTSNSSNGIHHVLKFSGQIDTAGIKMH